MIEFNKTTPYHDMTYDDVRAKSLDCQQCGLCEGRTQVVFGTGPVPAPIMLIGEAPGEQEDISGHPFVGRAGKLLTKIIESVGLDREKDIYITNTVKCRPPGNRNPLPAEVTQCQPYLIRQIQVVKPKIIILSGSPSLKNVLGDYMTISKARGNWVKADVDYMETPLYIMPIFHPSYLLRQSSKEKGAPKWLTWKDMQEVRAAYDYYLSSQSVL